ncbi:aa3-type cytochrome c oxidase subunit IV [Pelagibacterales bacterium SAG-MED28]|nr:aa3-type cytochrome c oxidase subunit IV [Pelagibacterales bacterium SAG-MED28]
MSEEDFKKTYNGFTKLVLWGTLAVIVILVILALTLL